LDELKGTIPSALIISAQPNSKLTYHEETKQISFLVTSNSFMVLDGQHRLFGLIKAVKPYCIPVVLFNNLNNSQGSKSIC
jgi:hypothetical protein